MEACIVLLTQKDFSDITIKEITSKAGVNRSTYYRNFDSKEDIIKAFYRTLLEKCVSSQSSQSLKTHLLNVFNQFLSYKKELLCLHKNHLSYHFLEVLNAYFKEFKHQNTKMSLEDDFETYYHTGGIFNTLLLWLDCNMEADPMILVSRSLATLPVDFKPFLYTMKVNDND